MNADLGSRTLYSLILGWCTVIVTGVSMIAVVKDRSMSYCLLAMAFVAVPAEIGCSSSGRGAHTGGASGSGGTSGAGGLTATGGGPSAGGALGTGGSGSADARGNDSASGGTGGALTADDVCRAALGAICDRFAACGSSPSDDPSTYAPPCNDVAAACPDYFFNETSTRTLAAVGGCLDELKGLSCTDLDLIVRSSCLTPGTAPAGAPCARASNCQSGSCSSNNMGCGVCTGAMVAIGDSCTGNNGCGVGAFCHPATKLCTPTSTIVHVEEGQPCDLAAVPAVGCAGDRYCKTVDSGTAGTCERRQPPIVVDAGQACDAVHTICAPNFICFTITGVLTGDGSYTSVSTCVPMDSCGDTACDETTYCKVSGGRQSCAPRAAAGERCLGDGGTTPCANTLYCASTTGLCTAPGRQGDACDDSRLCDDQFLCLGGLCTPLSTQACLAKSKDGGAE